MIRSIIQLSLTNALQAMQVKEPSLKTGGIVVEVTRSTHPERGTFTSNLPLLLAKQCGLPAREMAARLISYMPPLDAIERLTVGGPGFVNIYIIPDAQREVIREVLLNRTLCVAALPNNDEDHPVLKDMESVFYAYHRITGVLKQLDARGLVDDVTFGLQHLHELTEPSEWFLVEALNGYMDAVMTSLNRQTIIDYLQHISTGLHRYYNTVTLLCERPATCQARLCLLKSVRKMIQHGLDLVGAPVPEGMQ